MRRGMWVKDGDGNVGIVNAFREDGMVEFHQVDANGDTDLIRFVGPRALVQAVLSEIPAARRPTRQVGIRFGYA